MTPNYDMTLLAIIAKYKEITIEQLKKEYKEGYPNQLKYELDILQTAKAIEISGEGVIKYIGKPKPYPV